MSEKENIVLPSEEMRWKQYYARGYEDMLAEEIPQQTLWKYLERGHLRINIVGKIDRHYYNHLLTSYTKIE